MNVLSARRRTMRARVHADCHRSSRKERGKSYQKPDWYRPEPTWAGSPKQQALLPF